MNIIITTREHVRVQYWRGQFGHSCRRRYLLASSSTGLHWKLTSSHKQVYNVSYLTKIFTCPYLNFFNFKTIKTDNSFVRLGTMRGDGW